MEATLTFKNRNQAENFAINWSRYSKKGHTIGSGLENVEVTIYNVTEENKEWINTYVSEIYNRN